MAKQIIIAGYLFVIVNLNVSISGTGTVRSWPILTNLFTLASHSTAHSPTETTVWRLVQNYPPETTSRGRCMGRTEARSPTP